MKQNLLKTCLVMLLAVLGWGNAWADVVTITENFSASKATSDAYNCSSSLGTAANRTDFDYSWSSGGSGTVFKYGIKLGAGSSTGFVESGTILDDIPSGTEFTVKVYAAVWNTDGGKLSVTYHDGNGDEVNSVKDAANAAITSTTSAYSASAFAASTNFTFTKDSKWKLKIASSSKRVIIDKVEIVYSTSGGSTPEPTTYTVTVAENITGGTVTANPTSAAEGSTITLTATPATGYEFGAWDVKDASNNTITVTGNAFKMPAANVTVSATFNATEAPDPNAKTVTWVASEQGYTNGTQYTSAKVDSNISLAFGDGGNDGKYYDAGSGIRIYANGKVTVTAKDGCTMSKIVLSYSDSGYTSIFSASTGNYTLSDKTGTWKGTASSVVLTNTATSGHARIQSIAVTYVGEGTPDPEPTYYSVTIAEGIANGTVTATPTSAKEGDTVTLTATPAEGYLFGAWNVKGADGAAVTVTSNKFTMPAQNVTVSATFEAKPAPSVYASLAELVADGKPTTTGRDVTVTLTNEKIKSVFVTAKGARNGIFLEANGQEVEIYCANVPAEWVEGGTVSGTLTCPWKLYNSTWELCPTDWTDLTYTAPAPTPEPTKYAVNIAAGITNGTVSADLATAAEGATVTLTATPSEGYELDTWSVKGADNTTISVTNNKFEMPAQDVTVSATFKEKIDYTELPFAWVGGVQAGLTALNGVTTKGLGSDYAESHGAYRVKFDTDGDYIQVKAKEAIGCCTIGVKMIGGANASAIKVQESVNGTEFTDVETLDITGTQNTILTLTTSKALNSESRYVRFVFKRGSNVGVGPISIAKPEMGGTINFVAENNEGYWATFSSDRDVIFPETDVIVYTVAYDGEDLHIYDTCCTSKGAITDKTADAGWDAGWAHGYYVQANTGVLVYCDETSAKYYFVENNEENDLYEINNAPANNQLRPASAAMTGDFNFYKLAYDNYETKTGLGFYWGAENGAAFTCKAGTAYLAVPKSSASNLRGFSLEGEGCTTGIKAIATDKADAAIYNLQGQRVSRLQQGVNIVNGKKVIR